MRKGVRVPLEAHVEKWEKEGFSLKMKLESADIDANLIIIATGYSLIKGFTKFLEAYRYFSCNLFCIGDYSKTGKTTMLCIAVLV